MKMKKILYVSSSGGHLLQLEELINNVNIGCSHSKVIVCNQKPKLNHNHSFYKVDDCNAKTPIKTIKSFFQILKVIRKEKPALVISTGAALGGIAIFVVKLCNRSAKTIWVDSIANVSKPSLSGRLVKPFSDVWISQWQLIANKNNGEYFGKIFSFYECRDSASL